MPAKKTRANAFDDFPLEPPTTDTPSVTAVTPPTRSAGTAEPEQRGVYRVSGPPEVERIERLRPSQMLPDRFQPRRLLPTALRAAFFAGQVDCYRTAEQWLALARADRGLQAEVEALLAMGLSFEEHGQIKPITGSWVSTSEGDFIFQIETGERRFWAACLQYAARALAEEPQLRVEVVAHPTRQRQVLENQHAEAPSAVGRACEVAALILSELSLPPEAGLADEFDYFRQARQQSMTGKLWDRLSAIMQLTRPRMIQLLNILALPTPLLDLADRYRVPERVLREVLSAPRGQWDSLLRSSIQNNLTSDDVAELTQKPRAPKKPAPASPPDPAQGAISALKRFAALMDSLDDAYRDGVLDVLADDLIVNGRAEAVVDWTQALARRIQVRQQGSRRRH